MVRILVLQHLAVEHPGVFRELWAAAGHPWDAIALNEGGRVPDLETYDLLVALGGPMAVWQEDELPWLADEMAVVRRWVLELGRPCLGICLGRQLLAAVVEAVCSSQSPATPSPTMLLGSHTLSHVAASTWPEARAAVSRSVVPSPRA